MSEITPTTLERLLERAAARIRRYTPHEAAAAQRAGAHLFDVRGSGERARDGVVPGAVHLPRTVLEWRLAPDSAWRRADAPALDDEVILLCDHGCSSILAAATLAELGFTRVGDVIGGYEAWVAAGLPTRAVPGPAPAGIPGTGPPD